VNVNVNIQGLATQCLARIAFYYTELYITITFTYLVFFFFFASAQNYISFPASCQMAGFFAG